MNHWSGRRVSNSRPQPWQGCALPTELLPLRSSSLTAVKHWSGRRVSNSRPQPWQGCALPTELLPQWSLTNLLLLLPQPHLAMTGAGEESRTLDLNLGKVALYQLSYSRVAGTCDYLRFFTAFQDNLFAASTGKLWSGRRVSNSRPQPWQGCALPTELLPLRFVCCNVAQQAGIIEMLSYVSRMTCQKPRPCPIFP